MGDFYVPNMMIGAPGTTGGSPLSPVTNQTQTPGSTWWNPMIGAPGTNTANQATNASIYNPTNTLSSTTPTTTNIWWNPMQGAPGTTTQSSANHTANPTNTWWNPFGVQKRPAEPKVNLGRMNVSNAMMNSRYYNPNSGGFQ